MNGLFVWRRAVAQLIGSRLYTCIFAVRGSCIKKMAEIP
jgi:hypothetical protein